MRSLPAAPAGIRSSGLAGTGRQQEEQMEQHGGDSGGRKPGAAGAAGPAAGALCPAERKMEVLGSAGAKGGVNGARLNVVLGVSEQADPAPSCSPSSCATRHCNEFLELSPAPGAHSNGLSNAHSSQGHSCRNHSSASPPQAPSTALSAAGTRDSKRLFLVLQWTKEKVLATRILNRANPGVHLPCRNVESSSRIRARSHGRSRWAVEGGSRR